jgi:type II secretory pathway pseudopilin PulG
MVRGSRGHTMMEIVVTMGIASTILGLAVVNYRDMMISSKSSKEELMQNLRNIQRKALSTTTNYIVKPVSNYDLAAYPVESCSGNVVEIDKTLQSSLSYGQFLSTEWSFCFKADGRSSSHVSIKLLGNDGGVSIVDVLLGGAVIDLL